LIWSECESKIEYFVDENFLFQQNYSYLLTKENFMVRPVGSESVYESHSQYGASAQSFNPLASIARKCALYASPMFLLLATLPTAEAGPFGLLICLALCLEGATRISPTCYNNCIKNFPV